MGEGQGGGKRGAAGSKTAKGEKDQTGELHKHQSTARTLESPLPLRSIGFSILLVSIEGWKRIFPLCFRLLI